MTSIKNLTRFTYETAAFQGWRLSISRAGTAFTQYFSDKKYSGEKPAFVAAETTLTALKALLDTAKKVNGKHTATTIRKGEKLLKQA